MTLDSFKKFFAMEVERGATPIFKDGELVGCSWGEINQQQKEAIELVKEVFNVTH